MSKMNTNLQELVLSAPDWNTVSAIELTSDPFMESPSRLVLETDSGDLLVECFHDGVRLFSRNQRQYDYGLIVNKPSPESLQFTSNSNSTSVSSKSLTVGITHKPFSVSIQNIAGKQLLKSPDDGHFVRKHRVPPIAKTQAGWLFSHALSSSEPVYGLGEKWGALNKRGQIIRSFNHDALGVNAEISYKNTPFCWSPQGWGLFVNTPSAVTHSIGHPSWSQRSYACLVEDEYLDIYILLGDLDTQTQDVNIGAQLIKQYTSLTGRAPVPPTWSGGVILSKAYYADSEEILSVAREVRKRAMPCDVITFDGRAWQDTQTRFAFEWDASRYPDPKPVLDELKSLGFKICVWEYPLVSVQHPWFKEFSDKGWFLTDKRTGKAYEYEWDRQAFDDVLTPLPNSGIVDFTNPDAYAFWRDAHQPLFAMGVDMIKADFGEQLEDEHMLAHNGEDGLSLHNVYAHLYNRCVYEAAERYCQSGAFIFSRSAWTGSQRYNSQWGGDPQADWEGMMANLRGGLSWGLTGAPFYATDVGGFYKDTRDDALYVRWAQAGIFSAHFRLHGIGSREPWSYSEAACEAVMSALQLRYELQHYLQKIMRESSQSGMPVQRPMVLAFPDERQSWAFENQFMFGDDIFVAPCFDPHGEVEFYLPKGEWVQFDPSQENEGICFSGSAVIKLQLALDEMAVFIRKGIQIPLNKLVERCDQIPINDNDEFVIERYWPK